MYELKVLPSARKDLDSLEKTVFERIKLKILGLRQEPRPVGSLKLSADGGYRVRVGDYRVLYRVDDAIKTVFLYRIKHRRDAYR
ncbi:MAG: type II toxin-antitoxin system RelE/ParE family toxin [Elusimicrobia bacterium]|nr:type II toxin-antitoxin system RelE/ParE family toxin [Elusimicrobiota bacterium]